MNWFDFLFHKNSLMLTQPIVQTTINAEDSYNKKFIVNTTNVGIGESIWFRASYKEQYSVSYRYGTKLAQNNHTDTIGYAQQHEGFPIRMRIAHYGNQIAINVVFLDDIHPFVCRAYFDPNMQLENLLYDCQDNHDITSEPSLLLRHRPTDDSPVNLLRTNFFKDELIQMSYLAQKTNEDRFFMLKELLKDELV